MSETIQRDNITSAVAKNLLSNDAHRMAQIISLDASNDVAKPIQLWQLYSVLGPDRIVAIVKDFYERVFNDTELRDSLEDQAVDASRYPGKQDLVIKAQML